MAALNFPTAPAVDQVYTANGNSWKWDGSSWNTLNIINVSNSTGILPVINGGTGASNATDARTNLGAGDVNGPLSSVDNTVVRFDSTTGKLIQGSPVTIGDTGAISGAESISNIDFAQFDTTVTPLEGVGKLQWDDGNGTLQFGLKGGNVNLALGQELVARVYNDSGVALTDGQVVYINGAQGNRVSVRLAKADAEATSAGTLGLVTEPIAIGAEGFVALMGTVGKLNTTGLTAGALVYLSATTAGAYTTTAPVAPNHRVTLGYVERVDNIVGSIYVKVDNGYEIDELHNVLITSASSGQTFIYDATAGVWKNAALTAGTGISVTNAAGSITLANTGVTSITGTASQVTASASTGAITLSLPSTINVNTSGSAATLTTARTINGTSFDGSANITTNSWGTARTLTIGSTGKSVDGSAAVSWSLTEIGAQPVDADLTAIAALAGTSGFLKKTAVDTWTLDTNTYLTGTKVDSISATSPIVASASTGAVSLTHANSGVTAGTYNNVTVNATGHVTAGSNTAYLTGNQSITLSGDITGSGATAITTTLANSGVTAGTYTKVTVDAKGRTTVGASLAATDIPNLDASKITSGTIDAARLPSFVDDVLEFANLASFPATGETGKIYIALDTNKTYRWSGTVYVYITSGAVDSVGGNTGVVTATNLLDSIKTVDGTGSGLDADTLDGNHASAFYLATNPSGYTTNTGTVTSVSASAGTGISVSGSPITTSGTLTITNTAPNVTTDISITHNAGTVVVNSSDGTDGTINAATTALAGVMSSTDKTKLDGIATGATANTGTVTSVSGTGTVSGLTLSGTVTTSGNLTLGGTLAVTPSNFASQTANTVLAAPNGVANVPTFRALVAADIPTLNQNTTGTASNVTGTVAIANGGTGATTASAALTNLGAYPATNPNGYITSSGSISGSSGSVTGLTLTNSSNGINPDSVTQNQIGYNTSVNLFSQTDGGLHSSAYDASWIHQIFGDFRTGQIAIRGKNSGTWQAWRVVLDSSNYTSYSPSLTGSGASGTWGINITGSAASITGTYSGTLTSSQVTTALGYTPYNSTNPNGYTTNTGTVTSVSGTGTVSGLSLSGTVTTSGSLSLSGTLSASIDNITDEHRLFNNMGDNHATRTSFDAQGVASTVNFGWRFVQGSTNGPGVNSAGQYYSQLIGLGNDYASNTYGMQIAYPRNVTNPYIAIRYQEGGVFGAWQKISAGYADSAGTAGTITGTYSGTLTSSQVTTALGYTPYNSTNPNGYTTNTGTVTSVATGTGLTGGTITTSGTISLTNTGVTAATYGSATTIPVIAVDAQGRITSASNQTVAGGQYFGSAATKAIAYNSNTIAENVTVTSGNNGLSAGPITINTGNTVTVESGSVWVIV